MHTTYYLHRDHELCTKPEFTLL